MATSGSGGGETPVSVFVQFLASSGLPPSSYVVPVGHYATLFFRGAMAGGSTGKVIKSPAPNVAETYFDMAGGFADLAFASSPADGAFGVKPGNGITITLEAGEGIDLSTGGSLLAEFVIMEFTDPG
jgi:hypothetical protein